MNVKLYKKMRENPRVIGVKNSSMPVQDIQMFKDVGGDDSIIFNGPDEQFVAGRLIGADAGIGGTYAVMPELFLAANDAVNKCEFDKARDIQYKIDRIIYAMCECHGNLYAVMKAIIKIREGLELGGVRKPLSNVIDDDKAKIEKCAKMIDDAVSSIK